MASFTKYVSISADGVVEIVISLRTYHDKITIFQLNIIINSNCNVKIISINILNVLNDLVWI